MSGLTKAEKKRLHTQRSSSSAGVSSPSMASQVRKRSVDSVIKRKTSLDSIVAKRMRNKGSSSKLSVSDKHVGGAEAAAAKGGQGPVCSPRLSPKRTPFDVHVYAANCPGAHAAFFDAQSAEESSNVTLLRRNTQLIISKLSSKKKKTKTRRKKESSEAEESPRVKEDSGESSASENTKAAEAAADTADTDAAAAASEPAAAKMAEADPQADLGDFQYALMVLPHSASLESDARQSSLSMLPKRVQAQFAEIVKDVYMGELPVGVCVSLLVNRNKSQTRIGIVCLSRCDGAFASYDCMYSAVRNSLAHFYHKAIVKPNGSPETSKLLLVLPSLDRVKWNCKYSACTEAAAAAFQIQLAIDVFSCSAEERMTSLVSVDRMLQRGPKKVEEDSDMVLTLLRKGKLLERGLRDSKEVSRLIAAASKDEEAGDDHDQDLQDMAIRCIAEIISSRSSGIDENLGVFLRQNVLTTQSCLKRVIELAQNGDILLHRPVDMKDVVQLEKIGAGGTATVYKGTYKGKPAAIKLFFEDCPLGELRRELALMSLLEHPQLAQLIGASLEGDRAALILELVERGSLFQILKTPKEFKALTWKLKMEIALGVASSMSYLHSFGIIHRDLKSPNVLVTEDWTTKLTDYGSSRIMSDFMTQNAGTLAWSAPEVLMSDSYSEKADVYSFGMLLYEIATSEVPFSELRDFQVPQQVMKGARPSYDKSVPKSWQKLSKLCWAGKPAARPDFAKISATLQTMLAKDA